MGSSLKFETLGNATLQVFQDGQPILATDPWLTGTAYFGSWALEHELTPEQIQNVNHSPFVWISHGHPDHFHPESLKLLSLDRRVLVPDHYQSEIKEALEEMEFSVRVLRFKEWTRLTDSIRVMCLENENQDAILVIEAGDALIIDQNDSPMYGEEGFFKRLIRRYDRTYLLALCAVDADMINIVDADGRLLTPPPDALKPGTIQAVADFCTKLGVKAFCCSSSQHLYVRADSEWANAYHISFVDMKRYWNSPTTRLIEPFVTVDLTDGSVTQNHPSQQPDPSRISGTTGKDDSNEAMSEADWRALESFVRKFQTLKRHMDFIRFTVAGESRTFFMSEAARRRPPEMRRGVNFVVPRRSLILTVRYGYFDDLLIGNFMKTQLFNITLYPHFTPIIAKFGGNAKVYTPSQLLACRLHYFRLSPIAYLRCMIQQRWFCHVKPRLQALFNLLGVLGALKRLARRIRGLPPVRRDVA